MKLVKCLLLVATLALLTACPKTKTPMPGPVRDIVIRNRVEKLGALADKYDNAMENNNPDRAELYRNELTYQVLLLIDDNYGDFENDLFVRRATSNVALDVLNLGLSAATGITNGERVKSILAISQTAFQGGRKSLDLNLFRDQSIQIVILKMRASRAKVRQNIHRGMALTARQYPLGAALDDLINYLEAGSLNAALLELAQDAGEDAKNSRARAAELKISPFLTPAQVAAFENITDARDKLQENLFSNDALTRQTGERQMKAVLAALFTPAEAEGATTSAEQFELLRALIVKSRRESDAELQEKILKALNDALALQ